MVIGWDGAPWELLDRLLALGQLPHLEKLIARGSRGNLQATIPPDTGASWTSFATGATPGHHGIYGWFAFDPDLQPHLITSKDIQVPTFYEALAGAGYRSILVNLPVSYPPRRTNGIVVADLLSPRAYIEPIGKAEYLDGYRVFYDPTKRGDALVADILDVERRRAAVARELFLREPWDLFFVLVSGTDWMSHYCYRDLLNQTDLGKAAAQVFRDADGQLGWFLEHLPGPTTVILLSDHGFQACSRSFDINAWLASEGYLRVRPRAGDGVQNGFTDTSPNEVHLPGAVLGVIRSFPRLRRTGARFLRAFDREVKVGAPKEVDEENSTVFVPRGYTYGAYVNRGLVPSAEERDRVAREVIGRMRGVEDSIAGGPALGVVGSRAEIYGPEAHPQAPDILFLPSPGVYVDHSMLYGPRVQPREGNYHHPEGIIVAAGPGVVKGTTLGTVPMWSLAPTVLGLFGQDPLPTMDGRCIDGIGTP